MSEGAKRLVRKGLFLLAALGFLNLGPLMQRPAEGYCEYVQCLFFPPMHPTCEGICVCDCPIDPWGDLTNPQNCADPCK